MELGYDSDLLHNLPPELLRSFCGVGNPFAIGSLERGSVVLDIGCGAGFDLLVAHRQVGGTGRVCGVDLTEEMIMRAQANLAGAGISDIELKQVDGDAIPYAEASFDVVISNGVINLSPCKQELFAEIIRVLKPGGRLQFADIVLETELPSHLLGSLEAWSQ